MVILRFKEWLTVTPNSAYWVYDLYKEMPHWDDKKKDYVSKKKPDRITAQEAKELIKKHGLSCVCNNEHGRIYA